MLEFYSLWEERVSFLDRIISAFEEVMQKENKLIAEYRKSETDKEKKEVIDHFDKTTLKHLKSLLKTLKDCYVDCAEVDKSILACLSDSINAYKIAYSEKYPHAYVLKTVLNQSVTDFHIAQQCFNQRRLYGTEQTQVLYHADLIGLEVLIPAIKAGYVDDDTTVITHFQQRTEARTIPYYPAVLLSIPFTTGTFGLVSWLDYLTLPHEMGHHVYWNGQIGGHSEGQTSSIAVVLKETLKQEIGLADGDWRWRWVEELFADLYGCLIAGPINVLSSQESLLSCPAEIFHQDTDEHPIPELRPLIQTQMLKLIAEMYKKPSYYAPISTPEALHLLDERWFNQEQVGGYVLDKHFKIIGQAKAITGHDILNTLHPILVTMLNILAKLKDNLDPWSSDPVDASISYENIDLEIFEKFIEHVNGLLASTPDISDPDTESPELIKAFIKRTKEFKHAYKESESMTIEDWLDVISVVGWSTGGGKTHTVKVNPIAPPAQ